MHCYAMHCIFKFLRIFFFLFRRVTCRGSDSAWLPAPGAGLGATAQQLRRTRQQPEKRAGPVLGPGRARIEPEVGLECPVERHENLRIL